MIAPVDRRQFEEVRSWGEALRRDEREDVRAAGEAIRLLCAEIERIGRDLSAARAALAAEPSDPEPDKVDDTLSDEPELFEASLRTRLQRRLAALHR
jgi:predicted phage tail protein